MSRRLVTIDGNTAVAHVAHATNEVIAIYPITPSSGMGEMADAKSAAGQTNIWGSVPSVTEMQSEAGAAGAIHGALQAGALCTTFTASQGLLLMVPNMFKIAGELTPTVFHVSARAIAGHALSIFGDHTDVMATRATGFALLASGSVQEVMDNALIAQAATLESCVPFLHFFDGFRTSHEVAKVEELSQDDMRAMIDDELVRQQRHRALTPDRPVIRGTAQNPDVYFQGCEAKNRFYDGSAAVVQKVMDKFGKLTGRQYHLFDYYGAPDADRVIMLMSSGAEVAHDTIDHLVAKGEKVGLIKVRLFRPFDIKAFINVLPKTLRALAVLDRTKEPGAAGEPMYTDVRTAVGEGMQYGLVSFDRYPRIVGGRYGLGCAEFTPAMVKGVLDDLKKDEPMNHFVVGINDDITGRTISYDPSFQIEKDSTRRCLFFGLGSDGTVGATKNSVKIIGEGTDNFAQGYFVYDSKKAGSMTISHLRFGPDQLRASYLIDQADFIACHQFFFLEKYDMLKHARPNAVFLLNSPYGPDVVWEKLPKLVQETILAKKIKLWVVDAYRVAKLTEMGAHINVIMQTCFFAISGVLPRDEAIQRIKDAIKKTFSRKGDAVVQKNFNAVDKTLDGLLEVDVPEMITGKGHVGVRVPDDAPEFVKNFTVKLLNNEGDRLPVSAMPIDGTFPVATTQYEKRNIAIEVPVWDPETCIQCGKCSLVCPHASIRLKVYDPKHLAGAPSTFKSADAKGKEYKGMKATVQNAVEDCTGCGACVNICPANQKDADGNKLETKAINMKPQFPLRQAETENWDFFLKLPDLDESQIKVSTVKGSQLKRPLFEFSGACAGCGETPYVKLMTQLFGDRMLIANATGCSSIYGGNLPTTPYCTRDDGRGPAWSNSLFEDNAEFGLGMRLTCDRLQKVAMELLERAEPLKGKDNLIDAIKNADMSDSAGIEEQRKRVAEVKKLLEGKNDADSKNLMAAADYLVRRSVWILGGDGWAYDIGTAGVEHALAIGADINILVLDTQVYSNTGGQMSKATPRAARAQFADGGKQQRKKELGMMLMTYGHIYVGSVAMGANDAHTVKTFIEAESYHGPSIILAYAHCIGQGFHLKVGMNHQKDAVACGAWTLYRYDPRLIAEGKNPLQLDSKAPSMPLKDYAKNEIRFTSLLKAKPAEAERLLDLYQDDVNVRWRQWEHLASAPVDGDGKE
ncbi:MAG: pyruvate:ferredoxin (flavodoxin) oxidoreductase [Phycisphaerae bacterium]|nr:pyruvate:ferredoxin (flavodoxin) oxidoreductase [Phycisphaerae bacterium]